MAKDINVKITGDTSDLERALRSAGRGANKFGNTFGKVVRAGAVAAGAGIAGLAVATKIGVDELFDAQKVGAQTAAVLKSTGKSANVSAKQVEGLAESLMAKSGVDDEVIQSGENMLLTFTKVRNEVGKGNDIFNQATVAALDMATATGTDVVSANLRLGKALQDPIRGMTALRRVGVNFSTAQENLIRKLVETGDVVGAQKIILQELNKEFGGSAKAAGETLPGQLNKLKNRFSNFAGDIVAKAVPALQSVVDWLDKIGRQKTVKAKVRVVLEGIEDTARGFWDAIFGTQFEKKLVEVRPGMTKKIMMPTDSLAKQFSEAIIEAVEQIDWKAIGAKMRDGFLSIGNDIDAALEEKVRKPLRDKLESAFKMEDVEVTAPWDSEGWDPGRFGGVVDAVKGKLEDLHNKIKDVTRGGVAGASDMRGEWLHAMDRVREAGRRAFGDVTLQLGKTSGSALKAKDRIEEVGAAGQRAAPGLGAAARTASALAEAWGRVVSLPSAKAFEVRFRSITTVETNRERRAGRAAGGPVSAGRDYLVGERGPEVFVPNVSGRIVPNHSLGGSQTINLVVDGERLARIVRFHDGRWAMQNG